MRKFLKHIKLVNYICFIFVAVILIITVPLKIREHNYLDVFIVSIISCFFLILSFFLNKFFYSMAIKFEADDKYGYFFYEKIDNCVIEHSQVNYIKPERQRYVFVLNDGSKIYLSRITGKHTVEKEIAPIILKFYLDKIKY